MGKDTKINVLLTASLCYVIHCIQHNWYTVRLSLQRIQSCALVRLLIPSHDLHKQDNYLLQSNYLTKWPRSVAVQQEIMCLLKK